MLHGLGLRVREVRRVSIEGLVLEGRALPISVAAGVDSFDARQRYLQERANPVVSQCTSSLLIGLRAALMRPPVVSAPRATAASPGEVIEELDRRGIDTKAVIRAGIVPDIAWAIAVVAAVPALDEAGLLDRFSGNHFLSRMRDFSDRTWAPLLSAVAASQSWDGARPARARKRFLESSAIFGVPLDLMDEDGASSPSSEAIVDAIQEDPRLMWMGTAQFVDRVEEWLCLQLADDPPRLLEWEAPAEALFLALPDYGQPQDDLGNWIWERYTTTRVDDWSVASLLREWRVHAGFEAPPLPNTVWAERATQRDHVANLALAKSSERRARMRPARLNLTAADFVDAAAKKLFDGDASGAAEIFAGLVELNPSDAEALNNLGFCQLAFNPADALASLERASLSAAMDPLINAGNRVLAMHLLGHDEEALRLAGEARNSSSPSRTAYFWRHSASGGLELENGVEAREYLEELVLHISGCGTVGIREIL